MVVQKKGGHPKDESPVACLVVVGDGGGCSSVTVAVASTVVVVVTVAMVERSTNQDRNGIVIHFCGQYCTVQL